MSNKYFRFKQSIQFCVKYNNKEIKLKTGTIIKSTGSRYYIKSNGGIIESTLKGKFKIKGLRTTNPIAVGDIVEFEIQEKANIGVITNIKERKNFIVRKSTNLSRHAHTIAANIDIAFLIITLKLPKTYPEFIDRFLISAEASNIPVVLIFNKIDLYNEDDFLYLNKLKLIYEKAGYQCIETSVLKEINIEDVKKLIHDKIILVSGNSGVGKSSFLNLLQPGLKLKTEEISDYHKSGKHTTTFAEMFDIAGGMLIDTPGIKGFGLVDIEREKLSHYFPEMNKIRENCKFNNCSHTHEPDCAVKKAVENKEISELRYKSYVSILNDDETKYREDDYK